mgnify:CR=1 FL=1
MGMGAKKIGFEGEEDGGWWKGIRRRKKIENRSGGMGVQRKTAFQGEGGRVGQDTMVWKKIAEKEKNPQGE